MENQHRKISGYRELTAAEIGLMNLAKGQAEMVAAVVEQVRAHLGDQRLAIAGMTEDEKAAERDRLFKAAPDRWTAIATTHFQEGFMALCRAVAQPTTF